MTRALITLIISCILNTVASNGSDGLPEACAKIEWMSSSSFQCTEPITRADLDKLPADMTSLSITKLSDDSGFEGLDAFTRFNKLTHLEIHEGNVKEITQDVFVNMPSLDSLTLGMMKISKVADSAFHGLKKLKRLTISQNSFDVTSTLFKDLTSLELLYLMENDIKQLPADALTSLKQLDTLNLHGNALKEISPNVLKGLKNLQYLELATNKLTSIPKGLFSDLDSLSVLTLFHNDLSSLPEGIFEGLRRLRILDLNSNKLSSIPPFVFSRLLALAELRLNNNSLTAVPENAFHGLPSLRLLNLQGNKLKTLSKDVFTGLNQLQALYINDNEITDLGFVENIDRLSTLEISNNPISKEGLAVLFNRTKLQFLTMNRMRIRLTKDIFQAFKSSSVEHLDVGDNNIGLVESGTFSGFQALRELKMYRSQITYVGQSAFKDCKSLLYVDLSGNKIQTVAEDFKEISSVMLHDNPLHCNCRMAWLQEHLHPNDASVCASPEELSGQMIPSIPASNFTCWAPKVNSLSVSANGQLECSVCGDPTPQITIEGADGKKAVFGPSTNLSHTSVVARISLKDRTAGNFICRAVNTAPGSYGPVALALAVSEKDIESASQTSVAGATTVGIYVALAIVLVLLAGVLIFLTRHQFISIFNGVRSSNSNTAGTELTMNNPLSREAAPASTY